MRPPRKFRYIAALIALVGVLFSQLAVAAYICPTGQISQALETLATMHQASNHQDMGDCDEAAMAQPVLCKAQSQVSSQSLDKPPVPGISPFLAVALVSALIHENGIHQPAAPQVPELTLTRATAPPIAIQHCCFRI